MPFQHILLATLVAAIWGCNFTFVKLGVHEVPPLFLCAVRFFLASIPAVFFIRWPAASFRLVASYSFVLFILQFALIFTGMSVGMPAGMTSLLGAVGIFFSVFFAAIFIREIPTVWQVLGALVSFSGIALAATHIDNSTMTLLGFLLVVAAAVAWGLGIFITKKIGRVNMLSLVAWGSLLAFPPLLVTSLIVEGPGQILYSLQHCSFVTVISLMYIVYMSTWVGYGVWGWLLVRYPVVSVVPFTLLVPIFAMLSSALILGETFEAWKGAVTALVLAGLFINSLVPSLITRKRSLNHSLDKIA